MKRYLFTAVLAVFITSVCIIGPASSTEPIVTYENSVLWAGCTDVAVFGNYAMYTRYYGIEIFDITIPASPVPVGRWKSESSCGYIAISGNLAFVTHVNSHGFYVLDISDPSSPTQIGSYDFNDSPSAIAVHDDIVYMGVNSNFVTLVDVSNPSDPQFICNVTTIGLARDFAFSGNYVFVAEMDYGIQVFDISTPSLPALVESFDGSLSGYDGDFKGIAISGNYAFIVDYAYNTTSHPGGFQVFDISDPTDISRVTIIDIYLLNDLALDGNTLYISTQTAGLYSYDVSDPTNPVLLGHNDETTYLSNLVLSGSHLFTASRFAVVYDISDPETPAIVNTNPMISVNYNFCRDGDYAYLAHGYAGLTVLNIADPINPVLIGNYPTAGRTYDVMEHNDMLYVTATDGLRVYDLTDPVAPNLIGFAADADTSGLEEITISGNYAYITDCPDEMCIYDISNPAAPFVASTYTPDIALARDKWIENIAVFGSYAYVLNTQLDEVFVVDVSDPTNPVEVSTFAANDYPLKLSFYNGYGLLSGGDYTDILDMSDPVNPVVVGRMSFRSQNEPTINGDYMFTGDELGDGGFFIYNVANFPETYTIGHFDTRGYAWCIELIGDKLLMTDYTALVTFSMNLPDFRAGDVNGDESVNIGDAVYMINYIFKSGPEPSPIEAGDVNCDGSANIGDAVYLVNYIFNGGPEPCY